MMDARPSVRTALANRRLARVLIAYAGSAIGEWALWVAVLVYAFERGGSSSAGFTSIALLVPAAIAAPLAGRSVDGPHPESALLVAYAVQATSLAAAAVLAWTGAPVATVIVAMAVTVSGTTFVRPSISVVVPGLVVSPADLVAANLLTGLADGLSVLVGPLLASALLALGGPGVVFAVCSATNVVCVALTWRTSRESRRRCSPARIQRPSRGAELVQVCRSLVRERGCVSLLVALGAQYVLIGALDLLVISLAFGTLGLGHTGPGLLSATFGVGAFAGGALSMLVIGRRSLAGVMTLCLCSIGFGMLTLGAWPTLAAAVAVLLTAGVGRSVLDVSGRMLLQRCAPQSSIASVFAFVELLSGVCILVGSLVAQISISGSGVRAALTVVAAVFGVVALTTAAGLRRADEHADAPVVEIRLLRRVALFSPLPGPAVEVLARASVVHHFAAGEALIREGEPGDQYFVISTGDVDVDVAGTSVRRMSRGEGFGEIALLADLPRTATVRAATATSVLAIDRSRFLAAVAGHAVAARAAWALARTLHPPLDDEFRGEPDPA